MKADPFCESVDLNSGVGATVTVPIYSPYTIRLDAGGDLSITIGGISPKNARALADALNKAAEIAEKEEAPSWLK